MNQPGDGMGLIDGVTFGVFDRQQVADMTGREMLEAMMAGKLPAPTIGRALNFILTEVGDGTAVFEGGLATVRRCSRARRIPAS